MTISSKLYFIISPAFNGELYPVVHPDPDGLSSSVGALYAVYNIVGGANFPTLKTDSDLERPRVQISIYGINFDDVEAKQLAVMAAMRYANALANQAIKNRLDPLTAVGALPNSLVGSPMDDYEKDTKRYVKHLEYYCWIRS